MVHVQFVTLLLITGSGCLLTAALLMALPAQTWRQVRRLPYLLTRPIGLAAGGSGGIAVIVIGDMLGLQGMYWIGTLLVAVLVVLVLGIYLPGLDARQHARRRARLDMQAIDLAGYLRLSLLTDQGDVTLLRAYITPPRRAVQDLQALVSVALDTHRRRGGNVYDHLDWHAEASGCRSLMRVTSTVRDIVQQDRREVEQSLTLLRQELIDAALEQFQSSMPKREAAITAAAAGSLMFGLLFTLLYVMTEGGRLVMTMGGIGQ